MPINELLPFPRNLVVDTVQPGAFNVLQWWNLIGCKRAKLADVGVEQVFLSCPAIFNFLCNLPPKVLLHHELGHEPKIKI